MKHPPDSISLSSLALSFRFVFQPSFCPSTTDFHGLFFVNHGFSVSSPFPCAAFLGLDCFPAPGGSPRRIVIRSSTDTTQSNLSQRINSRLHLATYGRLLLFYSRWRRTPRSSLDLACVLYGFFFRSSLFQFVILLIFSFISADLPGFGAFMAILRLICELCWGLGLPPSWVCRWVLQAWFSLTSAFGYVFCVHLFLCRPEFY